MDTDKLIGLIQEYGDACYRHNFHKKDSAMLAIKSILSANEHKTPTCSYCDEPAETFYCDRCLDLGMGVDR